MQSPDDKPGWRIRAFGESVFVFGAAGPLIGHLVLTVLMTVTVCAQEGFKADTLRGTLVFAVGLAPLALIFGFPSALFTGIASFTILVWTRRAKLYVGSATMIGAAAAPLLFPPFWLHPHDRHVAQPAAAFPPVLQLLVVLGAISGFCCSRLVLLALGRVARRAFHDGSAG